MAAEGEVLRKAHEIESVKKAIQKEAETYRGHQAELSRLVNAKRDLVTKQQETSTVLEEIKMLDDDANVFKAVGPVLVKQDLQEARTNVENRLDFIKKDIERLDSQVKSVESKMLDREKEIMKLQRKLQGAPGGSA